MIALDCIFEKRVIQIFFFKLFHCVHQLTDYFVLFLCQAQETEDETDLQIHCITCGLPLAPKVALRHMEKCYMKV